jgi:succinylglutamate desuccinylase
MRDVLFIAGTHGNESLGVEVMQDIQQEFDPQLYGYDWIIGNPMAYEASIRFTEKDLNRSAPGDPNSPAYEERRAAEIVRESERYDAVIDLHGSVADCGVVMIIPYPSLANLALAKTIPLRRGVIWYSPSSVHSGPLAQHMKCPAIEIECGPKDNPRIIRELRTAVAAILTVNKTSNEWPEVSDQEFYSVYGKQPGAFNDELKDFRKTTVSGETFFPFMSNQYEGTLCYKMQRLNSDEASRLLA